MRAMLTCAVVAISTLFSATAPAAQTHPPTAATDSPDAIVVRAAGLIADAERGWGDDPEHAETALLEAVSLLEAAQGAGSPRSVELERTLGASFLLLGDHGRAVVHLRRAQLLDPTNKTVRETLDAARVRVGGTPPPDARERAARALLFWRGFVPRPALLIVGVVAWLGAWSLLLARRLGAPRVTTRLGLAALFASLLPTGALASERVILALRADAVVVQRGVLARNGPSDDLYPATFTEAVEPGLEVVVVDHRDGWASVRLASGQQTWLPENAIEMVTPSRRRSR